MKTALFLGVPLDGDLASHLEAAAPALKALFIKNDPSYLRIISHEGRDFIGKFADPSTTLLQLDQLETNIQSLLVKLLPDYALPAGSFFLLPTTEH